MGPVDCPSVIKRGEGLNFAFCDSSNWNTALRRHLNTLEGLRLGEYVQLTQEFRAVNTYLKVHDPPHSKKKFRTLAYQFMFSREIIAILQ